MVSARRPPNRMAEMGTPRGSSQWLEIAGLLVAGVVNRELGCAAGATASPPGDQSLPSQSMTWSGTGPSMPSHHTLPSSFSATLVKMLSWLTAAIALGFVFELVPGATPK